MSLLPLVGKLSIDSGMETNSETIEHPEAESIRRQVEFYFSDENLETDKHLLALCGGSQNLPVSLNQILGWKKMRQYRPKLQVIEALKKCPNLVIEELPGKRTIKRKIAFTKTCEKYPVLIDNDPTPIATIPLPFEPKEDNIQPHNIPAGYYVDDKGLLRLLKDRKIAGENVTDGPITLTEHEDDIHRYSPYHPVADRLEIAVQRFIARRKLKLIKRQYFDHFLTFGGIDTKPRQFTGQSPEDVKEMTKQERTFATAVHFIDIEKNDQDKWTVDFTGVVQSFFGGEVLSTYDYDEQKLESMCSVIISFYDYLLLHNVCPEEDIKTDISKARKLVVEKVQPELLAIKNISSLLPGDVYTSFNNVFGQKSQFHTDKTFNYQDRDVKNCYDILQSMGKEQLMSNFEKIQVQTFFNLTIEVIKTIRPENNNYGALECRYVDMSQLEGFDLPNHVKLNDGLPHSFDIILENYIVRLCYPGLKLRTDMINIKGSDQIVWVPSGLIFAVPSFYEPILNEFDDKELKFLGNFNENKNETENERSNGEAPNRENDFENDNDFELWN